MDALLFLVAILAVVLVMHWVVTNDRIPPDKPTRGLFAMRDEQGPPRRRARPQPFPPRPPG